MFPAGWVMLQIKALGLLPIEDDNLALGMAYKSENTFAMQVSTLVPAPDGASAAVAWIS
jgi:hypothetical protein